MIFWTQLHLFLIGHVVNQNDASKVIINLYVLGIKSIFIFFPDRLTLKFP